MAIALGAATLPLNVFGHADLIIRLAQLTLELEREPGRAELWLYRGDVRRQQRQFDLALKDFSAAERLKPGWAAVSLGRARTFYDAARYREALAQADEVFQTEAGHAEALLLRARCWVKLAEPDQAVGDYNRAVRSFGAPSPDVFLERCRFVAALGRFEEALEGLDEGLTRLGPVPALELEAIECERKRGEFDAALTRIEKMAARSPVKEREMALRAEVLEQAGRLDEARRSFEDVVSALEKLPVEKRGLGWVWEVEQKARAGLERVMRKSARTASGPAGEQSEGFEGLGRATPLVNCFVTEVFTGDVAVHPRHENL